MTCLFFFLSFVRSFFLFIVAVVCLFVFVVCFFFLSFFFLFSFSFCVFCVCFVCFVVVFCLFGWLVFDCCCYPATWQPHTLSSEQRIYLHLWRMEAVVQGVYYG